jgi:hypothetical protein
MGRLIGAAVAAILMLGTTGAMAAETLYDCRFKIGSARDGNAVPEVLVIQHETGSSTALIFDPIIKHFIGKPIAGKFSTETKARVQFDWEVRVNNSAGQDFQMFYTFVYYKDGRPAKVVAVPGGYDNRFSGEGTCKVGKG